MPTTATNSLSGVAANARVINMLLIEKHCCEQGSYPTKRGTGHNHQQLEWSSL